MLAEAQAETGRELRSRGGTMVGRYALAQRYNSRMARIGTVLTVHGAHARIETSRRGVCDGCAEQSKCAVDEVASKGVSEQLTARNPIEAQPGDQVEFELPGRTELKISLLVWIVPLVGLLGGAAAGANAHQLLPVDRDLATLIGLLLGAALAFGLVILIDRRLRGHAQLIPEIRKVLQRAGHSPSAACLSGEPAETSFPAAH